MATCDSAPIQKQGRVTSIRRPRLLSYGHDKMLLYTRKHLLKGEFSVETCVNLAGLSEVLSRGPVEIAVICHSVPAQECEDGIEMVRSAFPGVKVLVLEESVPDVCSRESDAAMDCMEGPRALIAKVHALLRMAPIET